MGPSWQWNLPSGYMETVTFEAREECLFFFSLRAAYQNTSHKPSCVCVSTSLALHFKTCASWHSTIKSIWAFKPPFLAHSHSICFRRLSSLNWLIQRCYQQYSILQRALVILKITQPSLICDATKLVLPTQTPVVQLGWLVWTLSLWKALLNSIGLCVILYQWLKALLLQSEEMHQVRFEVTATNTAVSSVSNIFHSFNISSDTFNQMCYKRL